MLTINYDKFDQFEPPVLVLCDPNKVEKYSLNTATNITNTLRYNAVSELTFDFARSSDGGTTINPAYSILVGKMIVLAEGIGYYSIYNVDETSTGATSVKSISCYSLEAEMMGKRIPGFTGTFLFLDLLQNILDMIPSWSIGTIDPYLLTLSRTFSADTGTNNNTILNFLTGDVAKAYGAIFSFDSFARTVSAANSATPVVVNSNVVLSFNNIISKITHKEITSEVCTALSCYGGPGLSIRFVNPLGGAIVYDFTYYKTTEWMSQPLIDALTAWEALVLANQPTYADTLTELETYDTDMIDLLADLSDLNAQLTSMYTIKSAKVLQSLSLTAINSQIAAQKVLISDKNIDIASKQLQIDGAQSVLRKIVHSLYFTSKLSFDAFKSDVTAMDASISDINTNWLTVYSAKSGDPLFSASALTTLSPTINTLLSTLTSENKTLLDALTTGFSAYPLIPADVVTLTGYINQEISTINDLYTDFQLIIPTTTITTTLDEIRVQLNDYLDIITYQGNMDYALYLELIPYIFENTFTNTNIIITDLMTPLEIQQQAQTLYDQALVVIGKASQPRFEFSGEFANFLDIKDFSLLQNDIDLGKAVNILKDDDTLIQAILLEMVIHWDDPTSFTMTFSNSFRLDNERFIWSDLLGTAAQLGSASSVDTTPAAIPDPAPAPVPAPTMFTWVLDTPAIGGIPGPRLLNPRTAIRIDAYIVDGTSVAFNIEERTSIGSTGTNLLASDMTVDINGGTTITFSHTALTENNWLWLNITGVDGVVSKLVVTLVTTGDPNNVLNVSQNSVGGGGGGLGDVIGPSSNTDGYIPQWNGGNSKTLKNGLLLTTTVGVVGADTSIPTEKAVRDAIDAIPSPLNGHVIEDAGTPMTQRANLNFTGSGVTVNDDSGNGATVVDITAGSGGAPGFQTLVDGADIDWDLSSGSAEVTISGDRTLNNPSNKALGQHYFLNVIQGSGNNHLAYDTDYWFPNYIRPTLSTSSGAIDMLEFNSDGTSMFFSKILNNMLNTGSTLPYTTNVSTWLEARYQSFSDALNTPCVDSDPVYEVIDQGGGGMNALQTTLANRPIFKDSILNGLPVWRFDGTNSLYFTLNAMNPGTSVSFYFVLIPASTTPIGIFDGAPTVGPDWIRNYSNGIWDENNAPQVDWTLPDTDPVLVEFVHSQDGGGRTLKYYKNGVLIDTQTSGSTATVNWSNPSLGTINFGADGKYEGDIAAFACFHEANSNTNRGLIETYLMTAYGI